MIDRECGQWRWCLHRRCNRPGAPRRDGTTIVRPTSRRIGSEFSLDDFGSGLGSFSSLKHLPIDYLKIDGTYTRNLSSDRVNQEMVAAMIKLARTMNFKVVAEQVEEQEDFDWLRDNGVDFVQGNFVDPPAPLGTGTTGTYRALTQ